MQSPMQVVYETWTTRANLEKWFLRKAEFRATDGVIKADNSPVQKGTPTNGCGAAIRILPWNTGW